METQKRLKADDSEMPADVSVKQPNKGLTGCRFKTKAVFGAVRRKPPNGELKDFQLLAP